MTSKSLAVLAILGLAAAASPAAAQGFAPMRAQSALDLCRASAPAQGQAVEGAVLHIADDGSVCVAQGPTPDQWIPLIVEGEAPAAQSDPGLMKAAMMSALFAKRVSCVVTEAGAGPARARCTVEAKPVDLVVASVSRRDAARWMPASHGR